MADNILQEFLVDIGFKISGHAAVNQILDQNIVKLAEVGGSAMAAAAAVTAAVAKIADGMEKLYFASARTHTSVENIQAFGFAATQLGSSATAARASLENLANFLRSSPAASGLLASIGVQTVDAQGHQRDGTDIMTDLGKKFAAMPIWRAQVYASRLGIDQNTLFAMINGLGQLEQAYKQMWAAAGLDPTGGSQQAHDFMIQLRTLGETFDILAIKIEASLSGAIGGDLERFRMLLVSNFGNIADVIDTLARAFIVVSNLFMGTFMTLFQVLHQLYDAFQHLNPQTKQWVEGLLGLIAAWRALNFVFALSPIGRVIMLASALLLLYQDYETWKNGGKSLIDWSKWEPDINRVLAFIKTFLADLNSVVQAIGGWQTVFALFLTYFMVTWSAAIIARLGTILAMLAAVAAGSGAGGAAAGAAAGAGGAAAAAGGGSGLLGTVLGGAARLLGGAAAGAALYFNMPGSAQTGGALEDTGHFEPYGNNPMAQQVRDYLVSNYGWDTAQANGIVANMMAESSLDPTKVGDNGAAYGIGQWHATRQAEFQRLFHHSIIGSSLGEQIAFYNAELRGQTNDKQAAAAGRLLTAPGITSEDAGFDVSLLDERPAGGYTTAYQRGQMATSLGAHIGDVNHSTNVTQHNKVVIQAPSGQAKDIADVLSDVHKRLARNLNTAIDTGH
jgi:hypothetical protein